MDFTTPSPQPMEVDMVTSSGCIHVMAPDSQGTTGASDGGYRFSIKDSGYYSSFGDDCRASFDRTTTSPSLRGGASKNRMPKAVTRQPPQIPAVAAAESDEESDVIDYEGLESNIDDDGYSTSSDWDNYGSLPLTNDEYIDLVARLEGSEDWNPDQRKLHRLIYMRGLHPMLPSWWRMSFRMWGVTQPHLDDVFTPKYSKKRVAIHAYGNEMAATKALESLFYLSQTVTDYEEIGYQAKISSVIANGIRSYIKWAMRDAGIDCRRTHLNLMVCKYPPTFRGDGDFESVESDFAPSEAGSDEEGRDDTASAENPIERRPDVRLTEAQRQRRFTRAVSRDLERRLLEMGRQWRLILQDAGGGGYLAEPPTLYAFAVVQHIVMLASHDPSASTNPVVVLEQIRLNERGQWLWNALSIALPVNMARDALYRMWDTGVIVGVQKGNDDDADL